MQFMIDRERSFAKRGTRKEVEIKYILRGKGME